MSRSSTPPRLTAAEPNVIVDTFDVAGCRIDIAVPPGELHASVRGILSGFGPTTAARGSSSARFDLIPVASGGWDLSTGGHIVRATDRVADLLAGLEWSIVTLAVRHRADLFHLHGAALRGRHAALALVGPSGAGKSTLALGLMAEGFVPYTDDVILIEPETLLVQPFRRAFHVEEQSWALAWPDRAPQTPRHALPPGYYVPERWADEPAPLAWIFFIGPRTGDGPRVAAMSPAEAASAILADTLSLEPAPRMALATVARLTAHTRCVRLQPADVPSTIAIVRGLLEPS